ncbi:MAG: Crp/Fnr family transcriptional regulator [Lysobacterales bacterium CG02_land_8_20_14_3_00_62_12]|nr:MAG: Crp/Fnr family transcriptional regulator [Xanthomonadales bacterium CG02_land_8_20_14_3_00_62_12]
MTLTAVHNPPQNHLLAALPSADLEVLAAHLELALLPLGEMLYEPGIASHYGYFPTTAIVSLHQVMASGASAEFASVGNEGMVGIASFLSGGTSVHSAVVHTAGHAYRLERSWLKQAFERNGALQSLLLQYTQALLTQMAQTAACYRHHSVEQQLCRWLLMTIDRAPAQELVMTQELVASMLGVRRESVTEAAGNLQQAGCIRYRRGHISVLDRSALEARVCECYAVVSKETARLLPDSPAHPAASFGVRPPAPTLLMATAQPQRIFR